MSQKTQKQRQQKKQKQQQKQQKRKTQKKQQQQQKRQQQQKKQQQQQQQKKQQQKRQQQQKQQRKTQKKQQKQQQQRRSRKQQQKKQRGGVLNPDKAKEYNVSIKKFLKEDGQEGNCFEVEEKIPVSGPSPSNRASSRSSSRGSSSIGTQQNQPNLNIDAQIEAVGQKLDTKINELKQALNDLPSGQNEKRANLSKLINDLEKIIQNVNNDNLEERLQQLKNAFEQGNSYTSQNVGERAAEDGAGGNEEEQVETE